MKMNFNEAAHLLGSVVNVNGVGNLELVMLEDSFLVGPVEGNLSLSGFDLPKISGLYVIDGTLTFDVLRNPGNGSLGVLASYAICLNRSSYESMAQDADGGSGYVLIRDIAAL
jgi:hypothetical protein